MTFRARLVALIRLATEALVGRRERKPFDDRAKARALKKVEDASHNRTERTHA